MKKLLFLLIVILPIYAYIPSNGWIGPRNSTDRISNEPLVSGDNFRARVDHVFDEAAVAFDITAVQPGDTIFINTMLLFYFVTRLHPRINNPYILITHNSDIAVPDYFIDFLNDPKLIAWFSPNIMIPNHPKLHVIPLGVNNGFFRLSTTLLEAMKHIPSWEERSDQAYLNFKPDTNPVFRNYVWNHFVDKPYCKVAQKLPYKDYLHDMKTCKFVISPAGFGVDCYRHWEALLMGAIPVIKHSAIDTVFEGLPVIFIYDWSMVDHEMIMQEYEKIKHVQFDYTRVRFDHWWGKIEKVQEAFRTSCPKDILEK